MKFVKNWANSLLMFPRAFGLAVFVVAGVLLGGAGCEVPVSWEGVSSTSTIGVPSFPGANAWEQIEPGVERLDTRLGTSDAAARLIVWRFGSEADWTWSLSTSTAPTAVSWWVDQASSTLLAVNAGYFHEDGSPSGWVQMNAQRWGKRAFDPEKSGIVALGVRPAVLFGTTPTSSIAVDAFQSYPFLLRNGKRAFTQETGQYARRTFVATDMDGRWYVGVVPAEPVTLYQLVSLLQAMPIAWDKAINLDGGPSTGLVTRIDGREDRFDSFAPVSYVIVARRRL